MFTYSDDKAEYQTWEQRRESINVVDAGVILRNLTRIRFLSETMQNWISPSKDLGEPKPMNGCVIANFLVLVSQFAKPLQLSSMAPGRTRDAKNVSLSGLLSGSGEVVMWAARRIKCWWIFYA